MADDADRERFRKTKAHLEGIASWCGLPERACTLVVDVGDLEIWCRGYQRHIDTLLSIDPKDDQWDQLSSHIGTMMAWVTSIRMTCENLEEPLNDLLAAVCNMGGAEDDENDD